MKKIFLTGAGISFNKPSSFPLANVIIEQILTGVLPSEEIYEDLLSINKKKEKRISGDYVRFELLMELLVDIFDPNFDLIDFVDLYNEPNELHYIISNSAIDGNILLTTNFDSLFEEAIIKLGKKPYTICYESDFVDFESVLELGYVPVVKLHGSFKKYIGNKTELSKETIQATLENVTSNTGDFLLANYKNDFLDKISSTAELIVLGYSGCDDFDVLPSLRNAVFAKVTWVDHSKNTESIDVTKNVITSLRGSLSPKEELFTDYYNKKECSFNIINQNTHGYLKNGFSLPLIPSLNLIDGDKLFKDFIKNWENQHVIKYKQYMIAGEIYNRLSRKAIAIEYLKKALLHCPGNLLDEVVRIKLRIINILNATSGFDESNELMESVINLIDNKNISNKQRAIAYSHYGYLLFKLRKLDEALLYKEKAIKLSSSEELSYTQSLHDKALILYDKGKLDESIQIFTESIKACNLIGNISTAIRGTYMLGCIYFDKGYFNKAKECYQESEKFSAVINDYSHLGSCKHELGQLKYLQGTIQEALYDFRKSFLIDIEASYRDYLSVSWLHFGICYLELEKYSLAKFCFDKSIGWFKKIPDIAYVEVLSYYAILESEKNMDNAMVLIKEALAYNSKEKQEKGEFYFKAKCFEMILLYKFDKSTFDSSQLEIILEEIIDSGLVYLLMEVLYYFSKFNMLYTSRFETSFLEIAIKYKSLGNIKRYELIEKWMVKRISVNPNIKHINRQIMQN